VNEDFIARLGHALRDAADREERRKARTRALLTARARLPRIAGGVPVAAVLALGVVLLAGVYALLATRPEPAQPPGPKIVARLKPGGVLDELHAGFGSAWAFDSGDDTLLRLDPATRRVTARIGLRAGIAVSVGSDALWVTEGVNDLLRIDPRTNRVAARIPLERGAFSGGVPLPIGDVVWVVGEQRVLRIDARTNRMTKAITVGRAGGGPVIGGAVLDGDLWVLSNDLRLVRLDGRTGAVKASFRAPFAGELASFAGGLYMADPNQAARLDPANGRVLWRTRAVNVGAAAEARGLIWLESGERSGDRVIAVDPRSGRTVARVRVGEYGVLSMGRVGSELWMTTAGGGLIILRP
jgi:streptogramin lyase